MFGQTVSLNGV